MAFKPAKPSGAAGGSKLAAMKAFSRNRFSDDKPAADDTDSIPVAKAAPSKAKKTAGKIPYDAAVWQVQDDGSYIHTLNGEVRQADEFSYEGSAGGEDA